MATPDDLDLDPQRVERIRARAVTRGERMRRRTRLVRRSAILAGLAVLASGGVAIAVAGTPSALHHQAPIGPSTTSSAVTTTSTTVPSTSTTVPSTPTSVPPSTTSTVPSTTTTTTPVTTTTVPSPRSFSQTLTAVVAPGTLQPETWTVPSSKTAEIAKLTIANTGKGTAGELRVQLLQPNTNPLTLLGVSLSEVDSPFGVTFSTDLVVRPGQQVALTVSCDAGQPSCADKLTFSGLLWPTPSLHTPDHSSPLLDVVASGRVATAEWTVPAGDSFSLTDVVFSAIGTTAGQVYLQILQPGSPPRAIISMRLAALSRRPAYFGPSPAITLSAGQQLALTVSCNASQPACDVAALASGRVSPAG